MNKMKLIPGMNSQPLVPWLAALLLLVATTACDLQSTGSSAGKGTLQVLMHDKPADFDELWIEVERVEVNNQLDEGSGWTVISEPNERYNILTLVNGAQVVLGESELDAGRYRQIRLILGDDNSIVVGENTYPLQTPSAQQTGVKLNMDAEIQEGMTYTLHLDFDASRSVVKKGNAQGSYPYLLKPVIRAYAQAETGTISGIVVPAESDPWIYAIAGEDTLSSTRAEENTGEFRLMGLSENSYTVSIDPADEDYEPVAIPDVEVTAGEDTDLGEIELTEATEEE